MIPGINESFELDGHSYIIQGEDQGVEHGYFDVRVMKEGSIVWQKKVSYQDLLDRDLDESELRKQLRGKVTHTLQVVKVALERGKLK